MVPSSSINSEHTNSGQASLVTGVTFCSDIFPTPLSSCGEIFFLIQYAETGPSQECRTGPLAKGSSSGSRIVCWKLRVGVMLVIGQLQSQCRIFRSRNGRLERKGVESFRAATVVKLYHQMQGSADHFLSVRQAPDYARNAKACSTR